MYVSRSYKALVLCDMSDVVIYNLRTNLVWLIEECPKVIMKNNNMV